MKVRETFFGGFFSMITFGLILYIVVQTLLYFEYDNVVETKALIPIVVVNQNWGNIYGRVEVNVILMKYGGDCIVAENI